MWRERLIRPLSLLLRLILFRPVVVIVPLIVEITMRGKLRLVGEKFLMVDALEIFNHVQQDAYQKDNHQNPPIFSQPVHAYFLLQNQVFLEFVIVRLLEHYLRCKGFQVVLVLQSFALLDC